MRVIQREKERERGEGSHQKARTANQQQQQQQAQRERDRTTARLTHVTGFFPVGKRAGETATDVCSPAVASTVVVVIIILYSLLDTHTHTDTQ